MMFTSQGTIHYDPTFFNKSSKEANNWLIVSCDDEIVRYYRHLFLKRTGISLLKPSWGAHISIIRGEDIEEPHQPGWLYFDKTEASYSYSSDLLWNHEYVWLPVESKTFSHMRNFHGLEETPFYPFHLTVGKLPFHLRHIDLNAFLS
jgi:hypothetical protein